MKKTRIAGIIMAIIAVVFVLIALQHPELSWSWSLEVTYIIYIAYEVITISLLVSPNLKTTRGIGIVMAIIAVVFILFAISLPLFSWFWHNITAYIIYALYWLATVILIALPVKNKQ